MKIRNIIIAIVALLLVWFFVFRTKELSVTYDSVETTVNTMSFARNASMKSAARNDAIAPELAVANMMSNDALYDESSLETGSSTSEERYRENRYYRVDTVSFDKLIEELEQDIKTLNGVIKANNQNQFIKLNKNGTSLKAI